MKITFDFFFSFFIIILLVVAIIYLVNKLRSNIKETIKYFNSINVDIKIISGNNLETVKNVSYLTRISKEKKAISLEGIDDEKIKRNSS